MKLYTFTFSGLSAYTNEWGSDYELLPRLFFSTSKDLARAYFPFVSQPAFTYQANPSMEAAVKKLKEDQKDELKTVLAIQKMVVDEIGSWNLSLRYTGFKCRTPEEVWNSNAGTHIEKTVLLATLLLKAGYSAVPVAIIPEKYYDKSVGSLYVFKDFAVQVKLESGKPFILSATKRSSQDLAMGHPANKFLILDGAIESLRTLDPDQTPSEIISHANLALDQKSKLTGKMFVRLKGSANPYFSLSLDSAYAKRYGSGAKEVELKHLEIKESHFDLKIEKSAAEQYGEYIFLDIPDSRYGLASWGFSYIETGRQNPIKLKELVFEQYHYRIELPDGYELVRPDFYIHLDNDIGKIEISLRQEGATVYATREIKLKKEIIQYSEIDEFNKLWKAWMNPSLKKIIVKK